MQEAEKAGTCPCKEAALWPSSGTAERGSLQLAVSNDLGETWVQYPSTPVTAGLTHTSLLLLRPGEMLGEAGRSSEPNGTHPSQLPPLCTKSESHCKNPNLCAPCRPAYLLLLLLLSIPTRWQQQGSFLFSPPHPSAFYHEYAFLALSARTVQVQNWS